MFFSCLQTSLCQSKKYSSLCDSNGKTSFYSWEIFRGRHEDPNLATSLQCPRKQNVTNSGLANFNKKDWQILTTSLVDILNCILFEGLNQRSQNNLLKFLDCYVIFKGYSVIFKRNYPKSWVCFIYKINDVNCLLVLGMEQKHILILSLKWFVDFMRDGRARK